MERTLLLTTVLLKSEEFLYRLGLMGLFVCLFSSTTVQEKAMMSNRLYSEMLLHQNAGYWAPRLFHPLLCTENKWSRKKQLLQLEEKYVSSQRRKEYFLFACKTDLTLIQPQKHVIKSIFPTLCYLELNVIQSHLFYRWNDLAVRSHTLPNKALTLQGRQGSPQSTAVLNSSLVNEIVNTPNNGGIREKTCYQINNTYKIMCGSANYPMQCSGMSTEMYK